MAGQPKRRAMIAELERRARALFETEPGRTVLDYVADWIENGGTMLRLADEISAKIGHPIMQAALMRYLVDSYGEEAKARLSRSRRAGAHALVEQSVKLVDEASPETREQLTKAKMQAEVRQWVAERWNKDELGQAKGATVAITVTHMHLDSMRRRAVATVSPTPLLPASAESTSGVVFEVVEQQAVRPE